MMSLLVLLKKQGVPVEEIYEKQFVKDQKKEVENSPSEDTENEALVSGKPKTVIKPTNIPKLNLGDLQHEHFSNNSFLSEF